MVWPAVIAGGAQILSSVLPSLLGGKQDNYHPEVWRNDMYKNYQQQIRAIKDAAGKYGFHPLALLGAGSGGGGFATPVASGNGFNLGDAIGAGVSSAADAFASHYQSDQDRLERDEERSYDRRQRALSILRSKEITPEMRLQRENMQLQNDLLRTDIATSRSKLMGLRSAAIGGAKPTLTDAIGITMSPPSGRASAQEMQDEYGDIVENVYGVGNWMQDMWNAKNPKWWDDMFPFKLPLTGTREPDYAVPVY